MRTGMSRGRPRKVSWMLQSDPGPRHMRYLARLIALTPAKPGPGKRAATRRCGWPSFTSVPAVSPSEIKLDMQAAYLAGGAARPRSTARIGYGDRVGVEVAGDVLYCVQVPVSGARG